MAKVVIEPKLPPLNEGDRVYLTTDPCRAEGTVVTVLHARYFVLWATGRSWFYPRCDLVAV